MGRWAPMPRWGRSIWNLELLRFINRVGAYFALMDDRYPSTDEQQSVHLDFGYPDAKDELNRWLPLVKWFLAIPHYIVLVGLYHRRVLRTHREPGSRSSSPAATPAAPSTTPR
jgi:hypothetical protein